MARFTDEALDLERLRRDRSARLRSELERSGASALLVLASGNVKYATGASLGGGDAGGALARRTIGLVLPGVERPFVWTPGPEAVPAEIPPEHVRASLDLESSDGVRALAREILDSAGDGLRGPLAIDDLSAAMHVELPRALGTELVDASTVLGPAKLRKTDDEIECIRRAQSINERAMLDVQAALRPGLRQTDLSALFLRRILELGASANGIDPIWQVMGRRRTDVFTTTGEVAFPLVTTDRFLRDGDELWVDTGIDWAGYQSDFGRTWIVGDPPRPTRRQNDRAKRWRDVLEAALEGVRPGATGRDLTERAIRAAGGPGGEKPWLRHFYLIHGVGTDPAEMPLIGTDLGDEFDEGIVLAPGMVLVLEPVIWEEGEGGYRAEEIVAVTENGYRWLSDHPYAPYEEPR